MNFGGRAICRLAYNIGNCAQFVRNFACSNKVFLMKKRPKIGYFIACKVNFVPE